MKVILVDPSRAHGKTYQLAKLVHENKGILVCRNETAAKFAVNVYGLSPDQVVTWDEANNHKFRGRRTGPIYIDDADYILASYLDQHIEGMSVSSEFIVRLPKKEAAG